MSISALVTILLVLALAAMLALVMFSGRLSPTVRQRLEQGLTTTLVVVCVFGFGWSLVDAILNDNWRLGLGVQAVMLLWAAAVLVRRRRHKQRVDTRQPGTFG